jgi:hypothetical protein
MDKITQITLWQLHDVENALRMTSMLYKCHTKETCFDREICKAWDYCKSALAKYYSDEKETLNLLAVSGSVHNGNKFRCSKCGATYNDARVGCQSCTDH